MDIEVVCTLSSPAWIEEGTISVGVDLLGLMGFDPTIQGCYGYLNLSVCLSPLVSELLLFIPFCNAYLSRLCGHTWQISLGSCQQSC